MADVGQDFGLGGVPFGPVPVLLKVVVELVRVMNALYVAATARIAVPVPGAANVAARLEAPHPKTQLAELVDRIHAGKSGANDDDVKQVAWRVSFRGLFGHSAHNKPVSGGQGQN